MSTFSPSYLFKNRFGKYYFRCRIPIDIRKKYNLKKVEVRKSLGTGNRTEALRLSRILWVNLEQSDYMNYDWENDKNKSDILLKEGQDLYKELQAVESHDDYLPSKTEEFLDWLAPRQKEALFRYQQYRKIRDPSIPGPSGSVVIV